MAHPDNSDKKHGLRQPAQGKCWHTDLTDREVMINTRLFCRLIMSSLLTFGFLFAPSLFSFPCSSLQLSTRYGGESEWNFLCNSSFTDHILSRWHKPTFRDTIHIQKLTSRSIIREGIREFRRSAFSTPSISRRNSIEIQSRRQSSSNDPKLNQLTISSLVNIIVKSFL